MVVLRSARFVDEAERFALRYTCEDCGHFDLVRQRCHHEWPTDQHRRLPDPASAIGGELWFCKEFEVR